MKNFLSVAFGVIMVATTFFIGGGAKTANAANPPSIYDYHVEYLINNINQELKEYAGLDTWGKHYFNYGKDNAPFCLMYVGDSKNQYIGFRLNADNTVRYAYFGINDLHVEKIKLYFIGCMASISYGVDLNYKEVNDLFNQMGEYIHYYTKNNSDMSSVNKRFTRFCPSINKNVYLSLIAVNDGKGLQIILGATN